VISFFRAAWPARKLRMSRHDQLRYSGSQAVPIKSYYRSQVSVGASPRAAYRLLPLGLGPYLPRELLVGAELELENR